MPLYVYIIIGLLPSLIWLLFFLRKDTHPESGRMILQVFFYGMLIAIIAAFVEIAFSKIIGQNWEKDFPFLFFFTYSLIGVAFVEEFLKYSVVRQKVLRNSEFDEPLDAMLYMIIVALGFAALENILVLLPSERPLLLTETIYITSLRFIGATFLHALCSGTIGFFLALSLLKTKKRLWFMFVGLGISSFLHSLYNFSIIKTADNFYFILIPIIILIALALFTSFGFRKLKKIASVCKL
ncbi:MAG: PrsW family glutamic-type intramembrane protease [Patescibacteria group bacterium]|nr:PrsW family glutamic-type intramembrane protease [Patescibacteria group bacterium]